MVTRARFWSLGLVFAPAALLGACSGAGSTASGGIGFGGGSPAVGGGSGTGGSSASSGSSTGSTSSGVGGSSSSSTGQPPPECTGDDGCEPGLVCQENKCVPGCNEGHACPGSLACCAGACVDWTADLLNCGGCGSAGPQPQHLKVWCEAGACHLGDCEPGFFDCDLDPSSGCEQPMECKCTPGEVQPCYEGLLGTENVGACHGGTKTCAMDGMQWGSCEGQVLPAEEKCANGIDDDCNGGIDDIPDLDGDGWTVCDGDCCEQKFQCGSPELVNPGAFEFVGNQVDDDCDPNTPDDQPPPLCSTQVKFKSVTAEDVAKAIDLCQFVPKNPAPKDKKWGVVGAEFRLANGNAPGGQMSNMQNFQAAILQNYGTGGVVPKKGQTMAGISSGRMRDQNDPEYTNPNGGSSFGSSSQPPAAYLAAHGGQLPASFGCKGNCPAGNGANDSVNARIEIRVPTNAQSFSYKFKFFSAEYWTYACTQYNDFYLALLTSKAPNLPKDKNISFDGKGNPVSVNNGFFDVCVPKSCYTCPNGTVELQGTGMQVGNTGGATQWLITKAPIVPGETMVIELMVFDVSDGILDSLTILDDFAWSVTPSEVGTDPTG